MTHSNGNRNSAARQRRTNRFVAGINSPLSFLDRRYAAGAMLLSVALFAFSSPARQSHAVGSEARPKAASARALSPLAPARYQATVEFDFAAAEKSRVEAQLDAIHALEKASDAMSLLPLANALGDLNLGVKAAALRALDERAGEKPTQVIRLGLNDSDPEFRLEVLATLAQRGDLDSLLKARWDANDSVKEKAVELLAEGGW